LDGYKGQPAQYLRFVSSAAVPGVRADTIVYDTPIEVIIRLKEFSLYELDVLAKSGIDQIDAAWVMRSNYLTGEPKPSDLLQIDGVDYQVIPKGVKYESDLKLSWVILTRRR